ncbi:Rho termination factor N-terminal domain-containing protein [Leptolyngbya sp. FACHB-711]|uniref:Rho termination factor N-terminal domain-containing protein n=1 Tax=unclassified Leptolyngbya TaxID=2650499 RepID=UPI0018EFF9D7|nr:Rho termination factor N-terminal domain-containing protein [Leptolyngbya sp. FACHB-711]
MPLSVFSADVDTVTDAGILEIMATADLKAMAKKRGIAGISQMKKDDFVEALSIPLK